MRLFFDRAQLAHAPTQYMVLGRIVRPVETPDRAPALRDALAALGLTPEVPPDAGAAPLRAVHDPDYLAFLETAHDALQALPGAGPEVLGHVRPHHGAGPDGQRPPRPPLTSITGLAGWHLGDLGVGIGPGTWRGAYASAQAAVAGADAILRGAGEAYALCRPPGHHATGDRAGGFCFLNNAAIAAERLRTRFARVAVADFDTHHGDGTQLVFYARGDVLTLSTHTDPSGYYPHFTGYADEEGYGEGRGANLNLPLPEGSGDDAFVAANEVMLARVREFGAEALVLCAGWDAHREDPLSKLDVTTAAYARLGALWGAAGLPTLIVQEGGYSLAAIREAAPAFVRAFLGTRT